MPVNRNPSAGNEIRVTLAIRLAGLKQSRTGSNAGYRQMWSFFVREICKLEIGVIGQRMPRIRVDVWFWNVFGGW